jgi:hypothetical protein
MRKRKIIAGFAIMCGGPGRWYFRKPDMQVRIRLRASGPGTARVELDIA